MVRSLTAFLLIILAPVSLYAQQIDSVGIRLENIEYPYPVSYMKTTVQGIPVEIAYMDLKPTDWNGKTIVLMHGKNFPSAYWGPTMKNLSIAGYRVIAPDALGFGKSSKPVIQYTFSLLALLTKQLLDTLHVSNTAVLGHSTGGMLATRFALTYPEMVTRLILEDPIGLEDWRAEGATYRKLDDWYHDEKNITYQSVLNYHKKYYANWKDEYSKWADIQYGLSKSKNYDQYAWVSALTYDMIFTQPVLYEFPHLKMPVLLMIGKEDHTKIARATPEDITEQMGDYKKLAQETVGKIPGAKLIEYDNSGHLPHFERSEVFLRDLKDFLNQPDLQMVYEDSAYQLTGVAVSKDGRIFVNYPLWSDHHKYSVVEVKKDGGIQPFPDAGWNDWKDGDNGKNKWVCVQAVYVDDRNNLWVVDPASPHQKGVYQNSNKLVKIDLVTDKVARIYPLDAVTDKGSYINDVRVDTRKQIAYLTNSAEGGIVIVNLKTGEERQVLKNSKAVKADPGYTFKVNGEALKTANGPLKINSDGIALTHDGLWLYFKPLTDNKLYRISTKYLNDVKLSDNDLESKVETVGAFTTTDGMITDKGGNIYMGDIEHNSIVRIAANRKDQDVLITDARLMWPDSYAISEDGYLYISCSQIENMSKFHNGHSTRKRPYAIYKLKLPDSMSETK